MKGYSYDIDKAKAELGKAKASSIGRSRSASSPASARPSRPPQLLQNGAHQDRRASRSSASPGRPSSSAAGPRDDARHRPSTGSAPITPTRTTGSARCSTRATSAPSNASSLQEPEVDELLDKALAIHRPGRSARKLYEEAARIVVDEAAGSGSTTRSGTAPRENCRGILFCPIGNGQEMRWAYYELTPSHAGPRVSRID